MLIELDMYQTLAAAVVVLMLGKFLRKRIRLLERFCIPAPVIGGVLFAIFTCVCYGTGIAEFAFDDILKEVCMVFFFTSVGFQANLKVLRSGGTAMIVFLVLVIGLIVGQNFVAIGLSKVLGISPLVGLCTGSIPMVGGHGTAGAFGPMLEGFGVRGATTLCTAAATYGLIAGSMMGGPVGKTLIEKHDLLKTVVPEDDSLLVEDEIKHATNYMNIQKIRYKNRFQVDFQIDEEILNCCTVKLIVQPLLENAIYYGVEGMDDEGEIWVRGYRDGEDVCIEVRDNGLGMSEEILDSLLKENSRVPRKGSGVGVINVHKRIQIRFGKKYGLEIESEPDEGTMVRIRLPYIEYSPEILEYLDGKRTNRPEEGTADEKK